MYPILFKFGGLTIHTYGFFVAAGFFAGILLAKKEAVRTGVNPDKIIDLVFFIFIASIVGARLFYVITVPKIFIEDPVEILRIWNGGLVFYGGFIAAFITVIDDALAYSSIFLVSENLVSVIIGIYIATLLEITGIIYFSKKISKIKYKKEISSVGLIILGFLILLKII